MEDTEELCLIGLFYEPLTRAVVLGRKVTRFSELMGYTFWHLRSASNAS